MSTERIRGLTEAYNKIISESLKENLNEDATPTSQSAGANPQFGRPYLNARPKPMLDGVKTMQGTKTLPAPPQRPVSQPAPNAPAQSTPPVDTKAEIDGLKNQIQILKLKQQVDALKKPSVPPGSTERTAADPGAPKRMGRDKPANQKATQKEQANTDWRLQADEIDKKYNKLFDAQKNKPSQYGKPWMRKSSELKQQNKPATQNEDVFDIVKNELIEEGHSEEEALSLMTSWTPEEINELRGIIEQMTDTPPKPSLHRGPSLHKGQEPTRPPKSPGGSVNRPVSRPEPSRPVSRPEPTRPNPPALHKGQEPTQEPTRPNRPALPQERKPSTPHYHYRDRYIPPAKQPPQPLRSRPNYQHPK